jgi:uncharacterized membrane protein
MMLKVIRGLGILLVATYPFLFYVGIAHWNLRIVAATLLLVLVPVFAVRYRNREQGISGAMLSIPVTVAGFLILATLSNDRRFILALPVLVNAVLLLQFASSLWTPQSLVERIARLVQPELSPAEVSYCRSVTWLWVLFFAVNGSIAALLAFTGPLSLWAAYTSVVSYLLIGATFTGEFLVRRMRFGGFGDGLHDRLLMWLWGVARREGNNRLGGARRE